MKIIETLRALGYALQVDGGAIRYKCARDFAPPRAAELLAELKLRKAEAVVYLGIPWPPESAESEEKFGQGPARLYPFLNKTVVTPQGEGRLWQVGPEQVGIVLTKNPSRVTFMPWHKVRPPFGNGDPVGGGRSC